MTTTIVIPAHNEEQVIERLLTGLIPSESANRFAIIVIVNGCTDNTAERACSFGPAVRVLDVPTASKHLALTAGDAAASGFPRVYVDADVGLSAADVELLVAELRRPGVLAAAPRRVVETDGCPVSVRWYYDVWCRLPQVRTALFGRGVVAVNERGHERLASLPPLLADDLAYSLSFAPDERRVVNGAQVVLYAPRSLADLVRRRVRVATGVAQLERTAGAPPSTARTSPHDLLQMIRDDPAMTPKVAVFLVVATLARLRARRAVGKGDFRTWARDESSRAVAH